MTAALIPLETRPWYWPLAVVPVLDAGPGTRSGDGSMTVRPFLAELLEGKIQPEEPQGAGL